MGGGIDFDSLNKKALSEKELELGENNNGQHQQQYIKQNGELKSTIVNIPDNPEATQFSKSGTVITFSDLSFVVNGDGKRCCGRKNEKKVILNNLNGVFQPGLSAILGPTGCGKTTLLNILAGRKAMDGVSGKILVNGQKQPSNFKSIAGYVIQDDMVMDMLTIRENIMFSARLRLGDKVTENERYWKVDHIINQLGLSKCADTKIGNQLIRGVSGGERKRTSIAVELITSSRVLFLDEPTTGLDAATANSVISILKKLTLEGMTVILSIHQPRYSIYKMFDVVYLMSQGSTVYHGPGQNCLDFFAEGGYLCEEHNNPSDFFLDVLLGNVKSISRTADEENGQDTKRCDNDKLLDKDVEDLVKVNHDQLIKQYETSEWSRRNLQLLEDKSQGYKNEEVIYEMKNAYHASFFRQLQVVSARTFKNMIRNRRSLLTQIFSSIFLALIVGSIYFQIDKSSDSGYTRLQNRVGAFFFIIMNYVFGNMSAVDLFIKERSLYVHEVVSGFYGITAYFFAKLFFDVIPQRIIPVVFFGVITFFMLGFEYTAGKFCFFLGNIMMTNLAGGSVALLFGSLTKQHSIGTILTSLVWVVMMVYSGVLVNIETIPHFLQWLNRLSIFRYSMNGFLVNEIEGATFCDTHGNTTTCYSGNEHLESQGIPFGSSMDLCLNEIALSIITLVFFLLAYIGLRRTVKLT